MRLERLVERQHDFAGALVDGRAGKPAEHRDFLGSRQADPLDLGVGDVLDVFLDLLVHRAVVRVNAAELQKLVDRHLVPGQLGVRRLDHRENVQHQLLLAQRKAVHCVLDQIVGFADNRLIAAPAIGSNRGRRRRLGRLRPLLFVVVVFLGRFQRTLGCHLQNLIFTTR